MLVSVMVVVVVAVELVVNFSAAAKIMMAYA
jgi:hypothetical protein